MVSQIYLAELQLNKANTSDIEASFLDLHLFISNDIISTNIYNKRMILSLKLSISLFFNGDVPCSTSYGAHVLSTHPIC